PQRLHQPHQGPDRQRRGSAVIVCQMMSAPGAANAAPGAFCFRTWKLLQKCVLFCKPSASFILCYCIVIFSEVQYAGCTVFQIFIFSEPRCPLFCFLQRCGSPPKKGTPFRWKKEEGRIRYGKRNFFAYSSGFSRVPCSLRQ